MNAALEVRNALQVERSVQQDITVCVDCSFVTRGFQSRFGIVIILAAKTGEVLDVVPCSTYCTICSRSLLRPDEPHICQINHDGKAGSIKVTVMKVVFGRSISMFNFR